jgi:hypothetical protein
VTIGRTFHVRNHPVRYDSPSMNDVIVGLLAVLIGAMFCFRGYLAMRIIIPIWGALAGFFFGAGLVANVTDDGFLTTVVGWAVGIGFALLFGLLAYLYYEICVLIAMVAIGFALGTTLMVALGVSWSWLITLAGLAAGVALAFLAIAGNMPAVLLIVLSAFGGASAMVAGALLVVGELTTDDFTDQLASETLDLSWWWYAAYVVLAVVGIVAQVRYVESIRGSIRDTWEVDGGRSLRGVDRPV